MVGDGAYLPVTHVGNAAITTPSGNISLNEVLVVLILRNPCCLSLSCVMIIPMGYTLMLTMCM